MEEKKLNANEAKFRAMVSDLMAMDKPSMTVECKTSSRARNLRRMFYIYGERIAERERRFLTQITYKLHGRFILIEPKSDWTPKEVSQNVPPSQGESTGTG